MCSCYLCKQPYFSGGCCCLCLEAGELRRVSGAPHGRTERGPLEGARGSSHVLGVGRGDAAAASGHVLSIAQPLSPQRPPVTSLVSGNSDD